MDSKSHFLGGVLLSRRKEVDKSRPIEKGFPQLRVGHPAAEVSCVHKAGFRTDDAPSHPPTHPPIRPHFGMRVCVSAIVTDAFRSLCWQHRNVNSLQEGTRQIGRQKETRGRG